MPLAVKSKMLERFQAQIKGMLNWLPYKPKLLTIGETYRVMKLLPTVSCHHGM